MQLLTELDDVEALTGVYVLAATRFLSFFAILLLLVITAWIVNIRNSFSVPDVVVLTLNELNAGGLMVVAQIYWMLLYYGLDDWIACSCATFPLHLNVVRF